ncbi:hypothetical protein ABIB00_007904 [Bradyrhizobium sp. LB14.3]
MLSPDFGDVGVRIDRLRGERVIAVRFGYRVTLIMPALGYALSALLAAEFIRAANLTPQRMARD